MFYNLTNGCIVSLRLSTNVAFCCEAIESLSVECGLIRVDWLWRCEVVKLSA